MCCWLKNMNKFSIDMVSWPIGIAFYNKYNNTVISVAAAIIPSIWYLLNYDADVIFICSASKLKLNLELDKWKTILERQTWQTYKYTSCYTSSTTASSEVRVSLCRNDEWNWGESHSRQSPLLYTHTHTHTLCSPSHDYGWLYHTDWLTRV